MDKLTVIKIGGNIIDDAAQLSRFLADFAAIGGYKILVHGGGRLATELATQMGLPQQLVGGRRITDAATLKVITMVYAGYINKNIVAALQAASCNAMGLCGADGNAVQAHKRVAGDGAVDYGFAGDVDAVNAPQFARWLQQGLTPVVAPVTHDRGGQLLNTNADTVAAAIAKAMCPQLHTQLVYCFEKAGVLRNPSDEASVIPMITEAAYQQYVADGTVSAGMIPKLQNAFEALQSGVAGIRIGHASQIGDILEGRTGTLITHE